MRFICVFLDNYFLGVEYTTMPLNIPSTSVRSKYLRRLPVGCTFVDPKSGYKYKVVEKKIKNTLVKVAVPYLASDREPILLEDIPKEFLKLDAPPKANIMKLMKARVMALEEENKRLLEQQHKPLYERIKENLNGNTHYETDDVFYCLHSGLVLPFKKKHYPTLEDVLAVLEENVTMIFKDSKLLCRTMSKQHSLQSTLLRLITHPQTEDEDVKEILL